MARILYYMNSALQEMFRDKNAVLLHDKVGHLYKSPRALLISSDEGLQTAFAGKKKRQH